MSKIDPHKRITLGSFKTYKRLDYPLKDDNFENLINNWKHYSKRLILFLGAGASFGAVNKNDLPLPQAFDLRNELYIEFLLPDKKRKGFKPEDIGFLSLDHVAALAEQCCDRKTIEDFVAERFYAIKPLWQHTVLPFLSPHAIFTTNYDNLIELGWKQQPLNENIKELTPIFKESSRLNDNFVPLYKSHGSVEFTHKKPGQGGIVLSMFDYFEMIPIRREMLEQFTKVFNEYCLIFIGYSMQDLDIAQQLYEIRKDRSGRSWYTVFPRDEANVRKMYQEHFKVSQINRTFHDFISDLDDAVNFIPEEWKFKNIKKLLDKGIIQGE